MNEQFNGLSDKEVEDYLVNQCNFVKVRKLKTGEWVGILGLLFTTSVCTDPDYHSPFSYRWCFEDPDEAELFYNTIEEYDEVPTVRTSLKGHRYKDEPLLVEYDELGLKRW